MNGLEKETKPTVVLVHGAFAESASWDDVIRRLAARNHVSIAAPNPLRSLSSDGEYVASVLRSIPGPVILVGHSYGGAVITHAARGLQNVKALVYVAAFAPDDGENAFDLSLRFPGSTLGEALRPVPLADGSADLYIQREKFHQQFAADVSADKAALMAATQRPARDVALKESLVGPPAWRTLPSYFVLAELDRNIPVALQRFLAERARARESTLLKGASHAAAVSRPEEVADAILRSAQQAVSAGAQAGGRHLS